MIQKIVRTPTRAEGGLTPAEKKEMDKVSAFWIKNALKTDKIDPEKIIPAIEKLYEVAGLEKPRVVIVPSPKAMALAGIQATKDAATDEAADEEGATEDSTYAATFGGAVKKVGFATDRPIRAAVDLEILAVDAVGNAAVGDPAGDAALAAAGATGWWHYYSGGNMWPGGLSYFSTMRDVLKLTGLNCWDKYKAWEDCGLYGSFRFVHSEFCIVSDFPEILKIDDKNRPHSLEGPSHRWRDGWSLYHIHGVKFEEDEFYRLIGGKTSAKDIMAEKNQDKRRVMIMAYGNEKLIRELTRDGGDSHTVREAVERAMID